MTSMILKTYNWLNILARKIVDFFYAGEKQLPLLYCNFEKILEKNFPPGSPFYFIQVGAFDGASHDILFDFVKNRDGKGLVIEPLTDNFQHLVENYSFNKDIVPIKIAIHSHLKEIILHRVNPEYVHLLPDWSAGITSIDPLHHRKTDIPSKFMTQVKFPATTLNDVL